MPNQFIHVDEVDGVLVITMDDPATRNAIGDEMSREISHELDRLEASPDLRCLVITGRDPAFCSGANVRRMDQANRQAAAPPEPIPPHLSPWQYLDQKWRGQAEKDSSEDAAEGGRFLPLRLHSLQKPSIAAVNGHAMGLGMGIAISCDLRIASVNARMSETFIRRGLTPGDGSTWQLPRLVGLGNTLLLQYTGDAVDAEEALRIGLVNRVTPHEQLMPATMELAKRLAGGPTYAMALIKKLVQKSLETDFATSLRLAGPAQEIVRRTQDYREGVRAFVEKRNPAFKGR